jgi:uncharacterized protein YbbC (DUF1343 family)
MPGYIIVIFFLTFLLSCRPQIKPQLTPTAPFSETAKTAPDTFQLGIDNFLKKYLHLVEGQRIGLLTNPSGVDGNMRATCDLLFQHNHINLTAYFAAEHGIRGASYAGDKIADAIDSLSGLPVYSLYGTRLKPDQESMTNVDVILVDIQDIGLRGYTFIYTMAKVMSAAAEFNKKVIVLDRPNPIGGLRVEGNPAEPEFFSFVGMYPIPYRHGMTIGELARLFNEEYSIHCDLEVIPMQGWQRSMYWDETGLNWVPTSPHIPHWQTALYMVATGPLGELYTLSAGIGYTSPFELVGAPWIHGQDLARQLNALNLKGIHFRPLCFKPFYMTYAGQLCQGVQLHITDAKNFSPYVTGLYIIQAHMQLYPDRDLFAKADRVAMFDKVVGTDKITTMLKERIPVPEIEKWWQENLLKFISIREKYLIY